MGANGHHCFDAGIFGTAKHICKIILKIGKIKVAVAIN
jgi:hypothetical protein